VRGGLLAASSATLAVGAHALADGQLPDTALTVSLSVLIGWIGTGLATRTRGVIGTLAVLGSAQLVMHLVLSTLATHHGAPAGVPVALRGTVHGWAMIVAHTAATLLIGVLVAAADTMLLAVSSGIRRLGALLPVRFRPLPAPEPPARRVAVDAAGPALLPSRLLRGALGRRGPPLPS
jgi:hypothetical protein